MEPWTEIAQQIKEVTGRPVLVSQVGQVGGGCINGAVVLRGGSERYFVKHNDPDRLAMFQAEMDGLRTLRAAGRLRVPDPICAGIAAGRAFLALECIEMAPTTPATQSALGRGLAQLHRVTQREYGWFRDNTIGSTPQRNGLCAHWPAFWAEQRLGFQLELAGRNGYRDVTGPGERLLTRLPDLLAGHRCEASLLHGDLWAGNVASTKHGEPVIFDPATYFGDRETDIAMTELFGGFSPSFYAAYQEEWPLSPGYEVRRTAYNLYHLLNHLNLFGRSYLKQCTNAISELLAELG